MTADTIVKVKTGSPFEVANSYSRIVAAGEWIFVSNTAGINYATREMPDTAAEQMTRALHNIARALEGVGATLADVVKAQVFVPNVDDVPEVMAAFGAAFDGIDPALTLTCSPLGGAYKAELEVTAFRGASAVAATYVDVVVA